MFSGKRSNLFCIFPVGRMASFKPVLKTTPQLEWSSDERVCLISTHYKKCTGQTFEFKCPKFENHLSPEHGDDYRFGTNLG
jgi:hypothetical protein